MFKYISSVFFMALLIASCSSRSPEVLIVLKTLDNPFFIDIQNGFADEWKQQNQDTTVTVKSGQKEGDVEAQRKVLDAQYSANVANRQPAIIKGLILTPSASGGDLVPQIKRYRSAGVPVILLDTGIDRKELDRQNTDYNLLVRSDNFTGGKIAANVLLKGLVGKECRLLVLNGVADHDTAKERRDGFVHEAKLGGCDVAMEKTANWRRDEAQRIVSQLTADWRFTGVFAANDEMALGAISALKQAGKTKNTLVVGFDAIPEAVEAVNNGLMFDTIAQDPTQMGREAAKALAKYIASNKAPSFEGILLPPKPIKH